MLWGLFKQLILIILVQFSKSGKQIMSELQGSGLPGNNIAKINEVKDELKEELTKLKVLYSD